MVKIIKLTKKASLKKKSRNNRESNGSTKTPDVRNQEKFHKTTRLIAQSYNWLGNNSGNRAINNVRACVKKETRKLLILEDTIAKMQNSLALYHGPETARVGGSVQKVGWKQ